MARRQSLIALLLLGCNSPCDRGEPRFSVDRPGFPRTLNPGTNTFVVRWGGRDVRPTRLLGTAFDGGAEQVFSVALGGPAVCDGEQWVRQVSAEVASPPDRCVRTDVTLHYQDDGEPVELRRIRDLPVRTTYQEVWELCP